MGGCIQTVDEHCSRNDVLVLSPLLPNDPAWVYDPISDSLHQDPDITDKVLIIKNDESHNIWQLLFLQAMRDNSDRLATFLRPASEQNHAVIFGTYKVTNHLHTYSIFPIHFILRLWRMKAITLLPKHLEWSLSTGDLAVQCTLLVISST